MILRLLLSLLMVAAAGLVPARGLLASARPAPALAHVRAIAVTPIADEVGFRAELVRWATLRLAEGLAALGVQVLPVEQAELVLREMGLRPRDLISPVRSADVGLRLGADAIITGRLLRADVDAPRRFPPPPEEIPEGPPEAIVTLDLRLLAVEERRVLLQVEVTGYGSGFLALRQAADSALRDFLSRLIAR
jgi:hypothetical protein